MVVVREPGQMFPLPSAEPVKKRGGERSITADTQKSGAILVQKNFSEKEKEETAGWLLYFIQRIM